MRYAEFPPPADLADYVRCLWVFEGQDAEEPQRIVPDGRAELILHWRAPYLEQTGEGWSAQPRALFAGQLTRPLHVTAREPAGVVGVRFRTAGAPAWLQSHANPFTDKRMAITDAPDLGAAGDEAERLRLAATYVSSRLRPPFHDARMQNAADEIRTSEGRIALDDLARRVGLSPRVLQRRFLEAVGVAPRTLASIVRFRRVFEALQQPGVTNWADAAQAAGYFDHPQMARDFQRFLGCTPSAFLATQQGLARRLVADANLQAGAARRG